MKSMITKYLTAVVAAPLLTTLTACVDFDSDSSASNSGTSSNELQIAAESAEDIHISAAGIKGPLAFADAKVYAFDPSFPEFYDRTSPISSAISSQFAEIDGLSIPWNIPPPYVLTVGGDNAIDLNSNRPPIISTLVTMITDDMLAGIQTVYATPLTTLVYHMARHGTGASAEANSFIQQLSDASNQVSLTFAISEFVNIDVFKSPLVINDATVTASDQEEAVHHRAALEAFAAKVHALARPDQGISADDIIDLVALDLQSDGVIDNIADGATIGDIDPVLLSQDPMELEIPNTGYRVKETMALMEEERALILTDRGPVLQTEAIDFGRQATGRAAVPPVNSIPDPAPAPAPAPAPIMSLTSFPVDLRGLNLAA